MSKTCVHFVTIMVKSVVFSYLTFSQTWLFASGQCRMASSCSSTINDTFAIELYVSAATVNFTNERLF